MNGDIRRARLIPELVVSDLSASLSFWCDLIGFKIAYDRPEDGFAYLDLDGAQVMLEKYRAEGRHWITAPLDEPYGRGINLQIEIVDVDAPLERLRKANWRLYLEPEEKWYRVDEMETGVRQFLVQDPDGYLLRLSRSIGVRPVAGAGT